MTLNKLQKSLNIKGKIDYIKIMSKDNLKRQKEMTKNGRLLQPVGSIKYLLVHRIKNSFFYFLNKKTIYRNRAKHVRDFSTTSQ